MILQEECHTIGFVSIQKEKYESCCKIKISAGAEPFNKDGSPPQLEGCQYETSNTYCHSYEASNTFKYQQLRILPTSNIVYYIQHGLTHTSFMSDLNLGSVTVRLWM